MTKDRRLGRGLAALLGTPNEPDGSEQRMGEARDLSVLNNGGNDQSPAGPSGSISDVFLLNVYEIDDNPFQPRREFGQAEIASLSESLKEHDMLQPVLVRRIGERYQLISGERRLRAAIQAGWSQVPARIKDADDRLVAELAIVENLQRKDLNAIEKALSFKRYLDEHTCTQDDLAQRLKIDRST
ncbi:MAG: ParB/RepB/Spo0J family partition protein, partial [Pirellulaceae bacterium]|nr:ParB/RepB/Spo0J family partition protein [Pirellulaceae bacterium]